MNEKQCGLLNILSEHNRPVSSTELAGILQVSSRTVKKYISDINKEYKTLIVSSQKGYSIDRELLKSLSISQSFAGIPQTPEQRVYYILLRLLQNTNLSDSLNIYDLSEEIFVSAATIRRDIQVMNSICANFQITVAYNSDQLSLSGKEKNLRHLLNYIYCTEYESQELTMSKIQELYPQYDAFRIKKIIEKSCLEQHYMINGLSSVDIVLDTLIAIDRMKHSFLVEDNEQKEAFPAFQYHELLLSQKIIGELEKLYDIHYTALETEQFTILLCSHLLKIDYQKISLNNLEKMVGAKTYQLAQKVLNATNTTFFKNHSEDFFIRFTLHLKNLLLRTENRGSASPTVSNLSLVTMIRNSCPFLFDYAVRICHVLHLETGYFISEDEIAYIALHIGCLLETDTTELLTCSLIVPQYYNLANHLEQKICERFSESITIVNVCDDPSVYSERDKTDLVISTIDFPSLSQNGGILISYLLTTKDFERINQRIDCLKREREKFLLIKHLLAVSSERYFFKNQPYMDRETFLHELSEQYLSDGYVNTHYEQCVLYRESLSSTVFNQIAVPHSMELNANRTMISVHLFDKPVLWGEKQVNIILLFAIHSDDMKIFHQVLDYLVIHLSEATNIQKILKCNTYAEFIDTLINL